VVFTDDNGNEHRANLIREDLESEQRYVFRHIRHGNLALVLKADYRGLSRASGEASLASSSAWPGTDLRQAAPRRRRFKRWVDDRP
jgi:hypothetical protein